MMDNNLVNCVEHVKSVICLCTIGQEEYEYNIDEYLIGIWNNYDKVYQTAKAVMAMSEEDEQKELLADLIHHFETYDNDSKGPFHILPPEASDAYVIHGMLVHLSSSMTPSDAAREILYRFEQPKFISRVPEAYIIGPYQYVEDTYHINDTVVKNGCVVFAAPSILADCPITHNFIDEAGKYNGMLTSGAVISGEYDGTPIFKVFYILASAVYEFAKLVPDVYHALEALYYDTFACDSIDRDLCTQYLTVGLAYGSPYWDYVYGIGETDCMDDDEVVSWHRLVRRILNCSAA